MHPNSKGFTVFAIGAIFSAALLAGLSAQAATLSDVTVAEGNGYTNVTVSATLAEASDPVTLVYAVATQGGTTLGSFEIANCTSGSVSREIDLGSLQGFVKGQTYYYSVSVKDASPAVTAGTTYLNVGWQSDDYFSASAATDLGTYKNGAWDGTAPTISESKFQIASTQVTFVVTATTNTATDVAHKIIDFQCSADLESYYFLDDITNDITSAICALALVTNDEAEASASWMVLKEGAKWVEATSTDAMKETGTYLTRIELDYNESPALARYSIKKLAADDWTVLTVSGAEWIEASSSTPSVQKVCFAGQADVASFNARLSTTNLAKVGGDEYATLNEALAAGNSVLLFTNVKINPKDLTAESGTWTITGGKSVAVHDVSYAYPETTGKNANYVDGTLTVSSDTLRAEVGTALNQAGNARYFTLSAAADAVGTGKTIFLLADSTSTAALANKGAVTLDLNGKTIAGTDADATLIAASGTTELLVLGTTDGGAITGNFAKAISAASGASVVIDGIAVTNLLASDTQVAIDVADASSSVVITNGIFAGKLQTTAGTFKILGGYYLGTATFQDATATGGKFTGDSAPTGTASPTLAEGYKFTEFAVPVTTNGATFKWEVMTNMTVEAGDSTKVWNVKTDDSSAESIGGVQLPDSFVTSATSETEPAKQQAALNTSAGYTKDAGIKKWECYVLGLDPNPTDEKGNLNQLPRAEGVQDTNTGKIGFRMATPSAIKAVESGCEVKYEVEELASPSDTTAVKTSGKVNWNENAEIENPSQVRYYKMKVYVSPKK